MQAETKTSLPTMDVKQIGRLDVGGSGTLKAKNALGRLSGYRDTSSCARESGTARGVSRAKCNPSSSSVVRFRRTLEDGAEQM